MCKFWSNVDDLGGKVATSLIDLTSRHPRTGWVRGDSAVSKATVDEITDLSRERRRLQDEVDRLRSQANIVTQHRIAYLMELKVSTLLVKDELRSLKRDVSVLEFFVTMHMLFAGTGSNSEEAGQRFAAALGISTLPHGSQTILDVLSSNNLIDVIFREGRRPIYRLTDYGKDFVVLAGMRVSAGDEPKPVSASPAAAL